MANPTGKGGFREHPEHRWRKGTPEDFNEVRSLAKAIANEKVKSGGQPIIIDGHAATTVEAILRQWATSKNPIMQRLFMEYAFGKVPDEMRLTGKDGESLFIGFGEDVKKL